MSEVKWIKLSTQMFEDEKIRLIENMPEADQILIIWIRLLSQAGKTNSNGYIFLSENIPYTDEMLATIFNRPLGIVRMALEVFKGFGMIEVDENQFISIANWEKHQNVDGLEKIRAQTKKRVENHRKKKQKALKPPMPPTQKKTPVTECNVTSNDDVTEGNATEEELELDLDIDLELDKDLEQEQQQTVSENFEEKEPEKKFVADDGSPGMVFRFFEDNIGPLVPHTSEKLSAMIDESSEPLVHEALKRAVEINATHKMKFVDAVLRGWRDKRIKTLADVIAADKEFERNRQQASKSYGNKPVREEKLPDWHEKAQKEREEKERAAEAVKAERKKTPEQLEAENLEAMRRLQEKYQAKSNESEVTT